MRVCSNCGERNEDWMDICQRCGCIITNANVDDSVTTHNSYENYNYDYNNYNYDNGYDYNYNDNTPKEKKVIENLDLKVILVILLIVLLIEIIYTLATL
jgi:uncharacterized membrane protein YvbJ